MFLLLCDFQRCNESEREASKGEYWKSCSRIAEKFALTMDNIAQQNMIAYAKQRLQKLYKRELYFEGTTDRAREKRDALVKTIENTVLENH